MSIIGILVALASFSFSVAQKKARDARRKEDIRAVQTAAEQYYSASNYVYPTSYTPGSSTWVLSTGETILSVFPQDPKGTTEYSCSSGDANGYCCCATLEGATGNSSGGACSFVGVGGTGSHYCVKNQQ